MHEPINGNVIPPPKTPDLPPEVLRRLPHAQWLDDFATALHTSRQKRGALVTPFLLGAITHLNRAAQYIRLLHNDLHWLSRDNKLLRKQVEHLGGLAAPPFRPDAEEVHDARKPLTFKDEPYAGESPPKEETEK